MDKFWIKCVELLNLSKNLVKIIYWYEHRSKKKSKKIFKLMNNAVFGKTMKMGENIEMLNLSQQKIEEIIWCQNQIIILQSFSQSIY